MSSSISDQEYRTSTKSGIFASTPIDDVPARSYTTSLSRIGTTSSSSGNSTEGKLQSQTARKRPKRKKTLKNKRKPNKKRIIQLNDTEQVTTTEWSTQSEEEVLKEDVLEEGDNGCINLFDDPCTPEKIRDAPIMHESPLHYSPILRSSRRFHLPSKRCNIEHDKLLSLDIPLKVQDPKKTVKDDIKLNRTNNAKTYKSSQDKEKKSQNLLGIYWSATYSPPCFSMSDLLWEKFVKENREEMPEYLASCSARVTYKQSDFLHKHPDIPPKFESSPHRPGSICIRGHLDKKTEKWTTNVIHYGKEETKVRQTKTRKGGKRKQKKRTVTLESMNILSEETETDVYNVNVKDEIDVEFETGGKDGKRVSLAEFRQKRKLNKC